MSRTEGGSVKEREGVKERRVGECKGKKMCQGKNGRKVSREKRQKSVKERRARKCKGRRDGTVSKNKVWRVSRKRAR